MLGWAGLGWAGLGWAGLSWAEAEDVRRIFSTDDELLLTGLTLDTRNNTSGVSKCRHSQSSIITTRELPQLAARNSASGKYVFILSIHTFHDRQLTHYAVASHY